METTNQDTLEKVMDLINQWRKKEAAKGSEPGLPMRQVYTQVKSTLPTMLKFFKALMRQVYIQVKSTLPTMLKFFKAL